MKNMINVKGLSVLCVLMLVFGLNSAGAAVSKEEPFFSIGTDFLVIKAQDYHPQLNVLFNNTNIYIDTDNDGTHNYHFTRNAVDTFDFSALSLPSPVTVGARIHTDKPVEYWQQLYYYHYYYNGYSYYYYTSVPTLNAQGSSYFVPAGIWYVVASGDIVINIDINNDGSLDNSTNVSKLKRGEINVPTNFSRIYSDKPFYLYDSYTIVGPSGTDFNIQWNTIKKLVVTEDNTTVEADINNDAINDWQSVYNKGVYTNLNFDYGVRIHSNRPIVVFTQLSSDISAYSTPSNRTGSDVWSKFTDDTYAYIIGIYDNTTYYLDKVAENDVNPDYNYTINHGEKKSLPNVGKTHVWGNKPFIQLYNMDIAQYYISYNIYPYSTISATQNPTQIYIGANELITMDIRAFNPFANTTINNVTLTASFPDSFSMPDGNVTLNIEKRYLRNDTLIASDTLTLTPSNASGNYIFAMSNADSAIFDSLDSMQYYDINYQIVTPYATGNYEFAPVQLGYSAETWNLPEVTG